MEGLPLLPPPDALILVLLMLPLAAAALPLQRPIHSKKKMNIHKHIHQENLFIQYRLLR
jgi:hypothetical protein